MLTRASEVTHRSEDFLLLAMLADLIILIFIQKLLSSINEVGTKLCWMIIVAAGLIRLAFGAERSGARVPSSR
jgi:hypothetical protein